MSTEIVTVIDSAYVDGKFVSPPFDNNPPWLNAFMKHGLLAVFPMEGNKAVWVAKTNKGIIVAEVGDVLSNDLMFGLVVEKNRSNKLTWDAIDPNKPTPKRKYVRKKPASERAPNKPKKNKTAKSAD